MTKGYSLPTSFLKKRYAGSPMYSSSLRSRKFIPFWHPQPDNSCHELFWIKKKKSYFKFKYGDTVIFILLCTSKTNFLQVSSQIGALRHGWVNCALCFLSPFILLPIAVSITAKHIKRKGWGVKSGSNLKKEQFQESAAAVHHANK